MKKTVTDEALLKRQGEDLNFSKDASRSYTLPARFYTDATIYELEKESIFYRTWHYAGHVSQVAEPRSYFTTRIHNQNLFVAHGADGKFIMPGRLILMVVCCQPEIPRTCLVLIVRNFH